MQVILKPGQKIESALKKLKKKLEADGFFEEIRKRQFYMSKSEKKRLKHKKAVYKQRVEKKKNEKI